MSDGFSFFLPYGLKSQLRVFGSQLGIKPQLLAAFQKCKDEESNSFRYVLVDGGPTVPNVLRVRSHIHNADLQYCYF